MCITSTYKFGMHAEIGTIRFKTDKTRKSSGVGDPGLRKGRFFLVWNKNFPPSFWVDEVFSPFYLPQYHYDLG